MKVYCSHRLHILINRNLTNVFNYNWHRLLYPKAAAFFLFLNDFRNRYWNCNWSSGLNSGQQLYSFLWLWLSVDIVGHIFLISLDKLNEICDCLWTFGIQIFIFLHGSHLLVNPHHKPDEFLLIHLLVLIKFDYSFLQNIQKRVDTLIVGLLLKSGGEAWINGHMIIKLI